MSEIIHNEVFPDGELTHRVHPELHESFSERLLDGVTTWQERKTRLDQYPNDELEVIDGELQMIEEEHVAPHEITLDSIRDLSAELDVLLSNSTMAAGAARALRMKITNLTDLVERGVDQYSETVRRHVTATKVHEIRPEQGKVLLQKAYTERSQKHELLIEALQEMSTFCLKEIPRLVRQSDFAVTSWERIVRQNLFSSSAISSKGAKREAIGTWALDMGIVEKARDLRHAVQNTLDNKKAEVA